MKNHWAFKLTAFVLAVISTAVLAVSGLCIMVGYEFDLYRPDSDATDRMIQNTREDYAHEAAQIAATRYAMEQNTLPHTAQYDIWNNWLNPWANMSTWPEFEYTIRELDTGTLLESTRYDTVDYALTMSETTAVPNGKIVALGSDAKEFPGCDALPENYVWTDHGGNLLPGLDTNTLYYELVYWGNEQVYRIEYFEDALYQVDIHLTDADLEYLERNMTELNLIRAAELWAEPAVPAAVVSALTALICFIYLGFAAGKKPGSDAVIPRGTNRLPLDLAAVCAGTGCFFLMLVGKEMVNNMIHAGNVSGVYWFTAWYALCAGAMALVAGLMLTALCAQARLGNGAWYKRSILGRCWGRIRGLLGKAARFLASLFGMLPLIWQWLLILGLWLLMLLVVSVEIRYHEGLWLLVAFVGALAVLYCAYALGKLRDAAKRMGRGDLDTKIDAKKEFLYGNFREFAGDLNALGDTCVEAAVERTKSERMKSELITNVSHDIKTPLTSIINYVDLLQKAETEEQKAEYLEVLERQSQRLKKLIGDLMEMSKASSGNITAELTPTDVVEAVNQALGEFSDRLEAMDLNIVFRQSGESIDALCDGKLLWRVMSNVLVNVVKYALPGTRVYVDVLRQENKVRLSVKNISREPLNISADELMERFVRGDRSRNSEGSGLGLNIARSLMEVQGGDLSLTVDGDLFKVTLTLNAG